ncbi:penicillin-binding protein 2 [Luteimonas deserti]|uniref:Peptidoglycan D,D-transpeptidase MrdA n=1 Tax=Luteimonas deserti TaxID=2752306 RepID=A0A7Z0QPU2_9GAMM|nr:penicillin-binding protein 2 [Luteimonas deserti]NYZ61756.1 penicillin-binding protein 2 [Luteimonas deserti]
MARRHRRSDIRDPAGEAAGFRRRALIGLGGVVLALCVLGGWYFKLQVIDHDIYAKRSEANRIKPRPVVPGRGLILDRKGRILAENEQAYRLDVTPEEAGDMRALVAGLASIVALSPEDVARFERERRAQRSFRAVTLKLRLSEDEMARFAIDRWRFPGVEVVPYLNRHYPYGDLFAHVVGYVGRTDQADVDRYGQAHLLFPQTGRTGLERYYDELLRGQIGYEQVETNVEGRALRRLGLQAATAGTDLRLSVDADLQRAMVLAFGGLHGSAVAVEPATGDILGMVSLPSFDPNLFVNGISHTDYRRLMDDPARPLFNRNVLGGGPPGSTIKPLVALAGVDSGLRTPESRVFSTGEFFIPGQRRGYRDAGRGAGWTDLRDSISRSINYYYYQLAYEMGIERFDQYMTRYGFGQPTGIDLLGETAGIVPSPRYKASRSREPWYAGETVIAGIGQGYWIATALQLARGTAAIASGGDLHTLHIAAERRDGFDAPWRAVARPAPTRITDNPAHLRAVQEGMVNTIHGRGTATRMAIGAEYRMAGKTGTAQRVSRRGSASMDPRNLPYHLRHQALFVGYAPAEAPEIAIAVVVEHGGYGGTTAAPIARKIFDAWLLGVMPEVEIDPATGAPAAVAAAGPQAALRRDVSFDSVVDHVRVVAPARLHSVSDVPVGGGMAR